MLRVASVPGSHIYVRHLSSLSGTDSVVRLEDPVPRDGRKVPGGWWDHGLRWTHAPAVVGHARSADDDDAPVIYRDIDRTATELERHTRGDGDRWRALFDQWLGIKDALLSTLFSPFPPVRGPVQLLRSGCRGGATPGAPDVVARRCDGRALVRR